MTTTGLVAKSFEPVGLAVSAHPLQRQIVVLVVL